MKPSAHRPYRAFQRPLPESRVQEQSEQDYVVLVYSANNVPSLGSNPKPVAGSFRLLPELNALAEKTKDVPVAIVAQGYEKTEEGRWETRRYRVDHGVSRDETEEIDGYRSLYSDQKPPRYQGRIMDSGEDVSMFSQQAVEDFLRDSMADYPHAKNVVLFLNAHGAPNPEFGGEAIIDGAYQTLRHEHISVKSFGDALGNVAEEIGVRLSLLDLNTCEMGKASNILELGEHADMMLASPQNEFVPKGHEYTAAFQDIVGACEALIEDPDMSVDTLGRTIISKTTEKTTFTERGRVENPIPTLDLYDTSKLPAFQADLDQAGQRLSSLLKTPEGRERVHGALNDAFEFRPNVVDLKGFLEGVNDPKTRALSQSLDSMVLHSYAGKFRGRDYSEAGPLAFFAPSLPPEGGPNIIPPETGGDLKPLLERLTSDKDITSVRRWVVGQSAKLNTLYSHLSADYPAMLEVLPNSDIEQAVGNFKEQKALLQIDRELMAQMSTGTAESLAPIRHRLQQLLAPLQAELEELDLETWIAEFEAMGGQEKMVENARRKALEALRAKSLKPVREYQQLDNLPAGWKQFLEDLTHSVTTQPPHSP